jgi:hypothetical protein
MMRPSPGGRLDTLGNSGECCRIRLTVSAAESPPNAARPVTISKSTAPSEKMSLR